MLHSAHVCEHETSRELSGDRMLRGADIPAEIVEFLGRAGLEFGDSGYARKQTMSEKVEAGTPERIILPLHLAFVVQEFKSLDVAPHEIETEYSEPDIKVWTSVGRAEGSCFLPDSRSNGVKFVGTALEHTDDDVIVYGIRKSIDEPQRRLRLHLDVPDRSHRRTIYVYASQTPREPIPIAFID